MDVDRERLVGRGLKDVAVIVHLHELGPVGGRATGGRETCGGIDLRTHADPVPHPCRPTSAALLNRS